MKTDPPGVNQERESGHLQKLRQLLSEFDPVKCGMRHEQIKRGPDGLYPVANTTVEHGFQRVTFCSADIRRKRVACAHTMARNNLIHALEDLSETVFCPDQVAAWKDRLTHLDLEIVQTDWKKGDAELAHARQSKEFCDEGGQASEAKAAFREIDGTIQDLVDKHGGCADRLSELLDEIRSSPPGSGIDG